jgi:SPP1 gp7 family putative phage head morphogenesis protein
MKNEKYWKKRQEEKLSSILDDAQVASEYVSDIYSKASLYTQSKINGIFEKYRDGHGLSNADAKEMLDSLLSDRDYNQIKRILENNPKTKQRKELLKKLDTPPYQYRIKRLENMQSQLDKLMNEVYKVEKDVSTDCYINSAFNAYYRNVYNLQKGMKVAYQFDMLDPELIDSMLKSRWSGKNYSNRIWDNTNALAESLKDEMLMGVLTNKTEKEMADTIMNKFAVGAYQARRLIQTESAAMTAFADQQAFKDAGIEKEMFIAVHDSRTSQICQQHDRSIVEIAKAKVGVNVPPLHPNCRSHMIPYIEGVTDAMKKRQRNPVTNKDEVVDVSENYDQWLKRQQEEHGVDTVNSFMKKTKNASSDRKQYNQYINVLGSKLMPNSLTKFQKIKYDDKEQWNDLKYKYRTVNRYKADYGSIDAETILELDQQAFTAKDEYMTTKVGKGNVASMKIGDDVYIASSQISKTSEPNYLNYVGDKEKLILLPDVARLTPHLKSIPYHGHEGEYSRDVDTEYKFFEYIYDKVLKGELKNQKINILSQKDMCFSCDSVYNELIRKQEIIDANININVVSGKNNRSWDYRKYKTKALNNLKKRVKK